MSEAVKNAVETLKQAASTDRDYAWGWHCNIAMSAVDAGCPHQIANEGAARFMNLLFDVNTRQHPGFPTAEAFDFGQAVRALKSGKRVARAGWNGKGMWLSLSCDGSREIPAENFWSPHNAAFARENGGKATVLPSITMKTATGEILMGWLASQTDMLAEDWVVVA